MEIHCGLNLRVTPCHVGVVDASIANLVRENIRKEPRPGIRELIASFEEPLRSIGTGVEATPQKHTSTGCLVPLGPSLISSSSSARLTESTAFCGEVRLSINLSNSITSQRLE